MLDGTFGPERHEFVLPALPTLILRVVRLAGEHFDKLVALELFETNDPCREVSVDVEVATSGDVVARCDGMYDDGETVAHLGTVFVTQIVADGAHEIVLSAECVDTRTHIVGQSVVRGLHVGKQGVGPDGGHRDCMQHGAHRGLGAPRDVVMPTVFVACGLGALVEAHEFGLARVGGSCSAFRISEMTSSSSGSARLTPRISPPIVELIWSTSTCR